MTHEIQAQIEAGNKLDFNPLWDYILLDPIKNAMTKGGLHIPEGADKHLKDTARGVCIKAGPGAYRDDGTFVPNPIKVGDVVFHMSRMQPFSVVLNGHSYLCVSGRDCVATAATKDRSGE
jgi:co-chaperonin GroES (HSP10)